MVEVRVIIAFNRHKAVRRMELQILPREGEYFKPYGLECVVRKINHVQIQEKNEIGYTVKISIQLGITSFLGEDFDYSNEMQSHRAIEHLESCGWNIS